MDDKEKIDPKNWGTQVWKQLSSLCFINSENDYEKDIADFLNVDIKNNQEEKHDENNK